MARNLPAGTKPGAQTPTNRDLISSDEWYRCVVGDYAFWSIWEYDQEELIFGPCNEKLPYNIQESKTWALSASGGVSMGGNGGLSGEHANVGVNWAMNQGFGYSETGGVTLTLSGEVPARKGFRPVLIIQYRVKEYDITFCDYHWVSRTKYEIKIKFRTVVGIDHGYVPCRGDD